MADRVRHVASRAAALRVAAVLALALGLAPAGAADSLSDPSGDAEADSLDIVSVAWSLANGTAVLEVRFAPGELPEGRAVRGNLHVGDVGQDAPAEWYHITITANGTAAYAGHAGPADAAILATSWTGDLARVEVARRSPAPDGSCAFAVVESGLFTAEGFVRHDVGPAGFASVEGAWPPASCPQAEPPAQPADGDDDGKGAPAWGLLGAAGGLAAAAALRRRAAR